MSTGVGASIVLHGSSHVLIFVAGQLFTLSAPSPMGNSSSAALLASESLNVSCGDSALSLHDQAPLIKTTSLGAWGVLACGRISLFSSFPVEKDGAQTTVPLSCEQLTLPYAADMAIWQSNHSSEACAFIWMHCPDSAADTTIPGHATVVQVQLPDMSMGA